MEGMAMATTRKQCSKSTCKEEKGTCDCNGCLTTFCSHHYMEHRETFGIIRHEIEHDYNSLKETLCDRKNAQIPEIDEWVEDSITNIKQIAEQCRKKVIEYRNQFIIEIENQLTTLTAVLKQNEKETNIDEIELNQTKEKFNRLRDELDKISELLIKRECTPSTTKISISIPFHKDVTKPFIFLQAVIHNIDEKNPKWKSDGITVAGGNGYGDQLNQLSHPHCICIDDDQNIYVADHENDRIVEWKCNASNGQIVAGGNGNGDQMNQFNYPSNVIIDKETNTFIIGDWQNKRVMRWSRQNNTTHGEVIISGIEYWGLAMDKNGSLYICDAEKNEVRRLKRGDRDVGTIVAGGNGKGHQLNQFDWPTSIFIDDNYSLYICDCYNHRVMKWVQDAHEGIVVAGGNGQGDSLSQFSKPQGIIVDQFGRIYVADTYNHRVMCWYDGATEGTIVVGGNGKGRQSTQFQGPTDLSFDRQGNLYVVDMRNNRIQKFAINYDE